MICFDILLRQFRIRDSMILNIADINDIADINGKSN